MPNTPLEILWLVLALSATTLTVYWLIIIGAVLHTRRRLPTAQHGLDAADEHPPTEKVCVIVPAYNEAGTIATLIESLKSQDYDRLRVVLALDRCTDDTRGVAERAIAGDPRFEIIEIRECPDDWAGKVHAAHTGYRDSAGTQGADILIFTDADTWFDPSCVRATVALARERRLDMLSLFCTLTTDTWYERVAQTAAGFELARQYPLTRANREDHRLRRPFANGQFMLFDARSYESIGGHESVRNHLLEDIAFARRITNHAMRSGLLLADGMVSCRMYDDWAQFRKGWKRIYTESANREPERLRRYSIHSRAFGTVLPLATGAGLVLTLALAEGPRFWPTAAFFAMALLIWAGGVSLIYRMSGASATDALAHPLGAWLVGGIFREAAKDLLTGEPTRWGGRSYSREASFKPKPGSPPPTEPAPTGPSAPNGSTT